MSVARRSARLAVAITLALCAAPRADAAEAEPAPAAALEIGSPLTRAEQGEAWEFCLKTLADSPLHIMAPDRVCGCFPHQWELRTNHLHRLILPITLAPTSAEAHAKLAEIGHGQGGFHDDKLATLSQEYQAAVKQSIAACR